MPDIRRKLSQDELDSLGYTSLESDEDKKKREAVEAQAKQAASQPDKVSSQSLSDLITGKNTPAPDSHVRPARFPYSWVPATAVRLGSGYLASEGMWPGALIAGGGETAAQKIESAAPVDARKVLLETGLGAIPFSKLARNGATVLSNAARLAAFTEAGNVGRRIIDTGNILPQSKSEALMDLGTAAGGGIVGAGLHALGVKAFSEGKAAAPAAEPKVRTDTKGLAQTIDKIVKGEGPVATIPEPRLVPRKAFIGQDKEGVPVVSNPPIVTEAKVNPGAPKENKTLIQKGRTVEQGVAYPADPTLYPSVGEPVGKLPDGSPKKGAASVEEAAPITPGVAAQQKAITNNVPTIKADLLASDGVARRPEAVTPLLNDATSKATAIAEAQLGANRQSIKAEGEAAREAERQAAQAARNLNARDKFVAKDQVQTAKNLDAADKYTQDAAEQVAEAARVKAAQDKIDALLDSGRAKKGPQVLTETTEKVPTDSGTQSLRQSIVEVPPKPTPAQEAARLREIADSTPDLPPTKPGRVVPDIPNTVSIPVTDPVVVASRSYKTEYQALHAIAGSGKVGRPKQIGRGKWVAVFNDDVAGAGKVGEAAAASTPVPEAPVAPPVVPDVPNAGGEPPVPPAAAPVVKPKAPNQGQGGATPAISDDDMMAEMANWTPEELQRNASNPRIGQWVQKEIARRAAVPAAKAGVIPVAKAGAAPPVPVEPPVVPPVAPPQVGKGSVAPAPMEAPTYGSKPLPAAPVAKAGTANNELDKLVASSGLPEGAVTVDVTGAKDGKEVANRVVNELQKYKAQVAAAEATKGVDEKGNYTYGTPLPGPLTIQVPGGPRYTVKPDQVDNAITRLSDGLGAKGYDGSGTPQAIKPGDAMTGIVDAEKPAPTDVRIPASPPYKLPLGPDKPVRGAIPVSQASAKPTGGAVPQAEVPITSKAPVAAAPVAADVATPDLNDLLIARQAAADKYWAAKEAHKAGTGSYEDVRATGKAFGQLDAQVAAASKKAGVTASPLDQAPEVPPTAPAAAPRGRGRPKNPENLTSDDITKLPPEQQEAALKAAVAKFRAGQESGASTTEILTRLGMASAGAVTGAAARPDDPITGALLGAVAGGAAGYYAPSLIRTLTEHLGSANLDTQSFERSAHDIGDYSYQAIKSFMEMVPDYYRSSLLSRPPSLLINSLAGPYGSNVMGALEKAMSGDVRGMRLLRDMMNPVTFLKEFKDALPEALERVHESGERADMSVGTMLGNHLVRNTIDRPAQLMSAGDIAAKKMATAAGFSEEEARVMNLTSEPRSRIAKSVGNARKTKVEGTKSFFVQMAIPFYRTNANQLEQSLARWPLLGPMLRRHWNMPDQTLRQTLVQNAMSGGVGGVSYMLGATVPKNQRKQYLKFITNFGGMYGTTAELAFIAGAAKQDGDETGKQIYDSGMRLLNNDMPLPTSVGFLGDTMKMVGAATDNDPNTSPLEHIPYGVVPPIISSKDTLSIPTAMRDPQGAFNSAVNGLPVPEAILPTQLPEAKPTKKEYSLIAPMVNKPELKTPPREITPYEHQLNKYKEMMRQQRKAMMSPK